MNKKLILLLLPLFIFIVGCAKNEQEALKKEFKIGDEKIILEEKDISSNIKTLIPENFNIMTEEIAKIKYPSEHRPTYIYTNDNASINITFNITDIKISDSNINNYLSLLEQTYRSNFPNATWYKKEIEIINDHKVGIIEILTPAIDTKIYNLIWFTEIHGKLLISSFNCIEEEKEDWAPIATAIMNSQVIK
jgi:hypothetical protein